MTPEQLAELKENVDLRKRLAKKIAHDCYRAPLPALGDGGEHGVQADRVGTRQGRVTDDVHVSR